MNGEKTTVESMVMPDRFHWNNSANSRLLTQDSNPVIKMYIPVQNIPLKSSLPIQYIVLGDDMDLLHLHI